MEAHKMRNYLFLDRYLDELEKDIYEQPDDEGHTEMAKEVINKWMPCISDTTTVLDAGCGTGFCLQFFKEFGVGYIGIDANYSSASVLHGDFTFTKLHDNFVDLVFSRHSLEHSPFPLLTLMEWHRVARKYLILVVPNPEYYTYVGRNHYSVLNVKQIRWLLRRSGWEIMEREYSEQELQFLCKKRPRVGYEGYVEILTNDVLEADQRGD